MAEPSFQAWRSYFDDARISQIQTRFNELMMGWKIEVEQVQKQFSEIYTSKIEPVRRKRPYRKRKLLPIEEEPLTPIMEERHVSEDTPKTEKKDVTQEPRENPFNIVATPKRSANGDQSTPKAERKASITDRSLPKARLKDGTSSQNAGKMDLVEEIRKKKQGEAVTPAPAENENSEEAASTLRKRKKTSVRDSDDFEDITPVRRTKKNLVLEEYETPPASQLSLRDLGYDYDRPVGPDLKPLRMGRLAPVAPAAEPPSLRMKKEVRMEIYWPILLIKGQAASPRYFSKLRRFTRSIKDQGKRIPFLLRNIAVDEEDGADA